MRSSRDGGSRLDERVERLRKLKTGFRALTDDVAHQGIYLLAALWSTLVRAVAPVWRRARRSRAFQDISRRLSRGTDGIEEDVRGLATHPSARAALERVTYAYRWIDVHHRLYTSRARRFLRHYLVVLIDPDVPFGRRAVHGAKGAGYASAAGAALLVVYTILLIPLTPGRETIREVGQAHPAVVLDARGEVITRYRRINREWVPLHDVSPHFINALLVTEDRRFFDHFGIDLRRILGAGVETAAGDLQGGSTITQQLARNLFPAEIGRRLTINRKLREMVTALKIEVVYSKREILESYVNTVPFLYNAVGIETAARTYFGKSAAELDVLESATLVGMLKGTFYYNPVRNPERAVERRNLILEQMSRFGSLDVAAYEELVEAPLKVRLDVQTVRESRAPHFGERVRRWLIAWADENGYNVHTDSLVVHTTLDLRLQQLANEAVVNEAEVLQAVADVEWGHAASHLYSTNAHAYLSRRRHVAPFGHFWENRDSLVHGYIRRTNRYQQLAGAGLSDSLALDSLRRNNEFSDSLRAAVTRLEAAFLAISPRSGHVKAWVGSRDFEKGEFDHVVQARRQAGSTFKPFLYASALELGYRPDDRFVDQPVAIELSGGQVWRPKNAGDITGRRMTLREGLAQSVNTISAQLVERVGAEHVADLARRAGVESELDVVPSIALGTSSVTLHDMVTAYATLAGGGIYREPVMVLRIEDRNGTVLYEVETAEEDVIDEAVTEELVDMMRGVVNEGTGRRIRFAYNVETDVAGKTGTTQDGADGWFMLMHPDLVAGAWVGFDDRRVTFRSDYWGQGAHTALPIVGRFFRAALRDESLDLERRPAPAPEVRYVRVQRRGVSGWFKDLVDGPAYRRVVEDRPRPKSDLGRRIAEDRESPRNASSLP